jgi:uncharacterized protein (TIGR02594 family)
MTPLTPYGFARRYVGVVEEFPGAEHHPLIQWWLSLCRWGFKAADETPWCSAFVNAIYWEFDLPHTKSAAARSWLDVGVPVSIEVARPVSDLVILSRPPNPTSGHVGFYDSHSTQTVTILGGNQQNKVTIETFNKARIVGVRRIPLQ